MKQVVVIGLGIFGSNIARILFENGFDVVVIDKNREMIQRMGNLSIRSVVADATDKSILETIGIQPDDLVIVSFGEDLAASTLLTLHLKEIRVKQIVVKAPNQEYKRILQMVGATEVIIPEQEMAKRLAKSIIAPNVLDFLTLSDGYTISELAPPSGFIGKSLTDLHVRSRYHVTVIAIRDALTGHISMVPSASFVIKDSDVLIVIGKEEDIRKLK